MKRKTISFLTIAIAVVVLSSTSLMALGRPIYDFPDPPPSSDLTITVRPANEHSITEGNSITFSWKATTSKSTSGYRIRIDSVTVKTGSWSSGSTVSYTITSSNSQYKTGRLTVEMRFSDSIKSVYDYVYLTVNADSDGDGLSDIVETTYTNTPINSPEDFSGPTVEVQVIFRTGAASISLDGRLDSEGYGTIPRRLYHSIQKSINTLSSNIVQIRRTDKIKVLQIDTWALTWYISHGFVVSECIFLETFVGYTTKWERDSHDIKNGGVLQGLQTAESEGYDIICIALSGSFTYTEKQIVDRLVTELGTTIICGTGNDGLSTISGKAKYKHTIAIGAAWISIFNGDSIVEDSNYGQELDFVCNSLGPINAPVTRTSWATGHCTAYVINMLCANQNLDPTTLRDLMRDNADQIEDQDHTYGAYPYYQYLTWPNYGWCDRFGYGYIRNHDLHDAAEAQLDDPI